jgi:hypothetical protein
MDENVVENNRDAVERSSFLLILGWITLFILYWEQVGLLVSILAIPHDFLFFVPAFVFTCLFLRRYWPAKHADEDQGIWYVWAIWGTYIVAYVVVVAVIFGTVAKDLTEEDALGINVLKMTLSITPGLLILFLQLTICPSYRKPVLYLSIVAALNIFDGIQMLEIYLMQNERHFDFDSATEDLKDFLMQNGGNKTERLKDVLMRSERPFDLNSETEVCIIFFACVCFLLSSFGLVRNKFGANGEVKERETTSAVFGLLEIFGTNFPFLVLRIVIWKNHQYNASLFIAKNVVSLLIGAVVFGLLKGMWKCGIPNRERPNAA